YMPIQEGKKVTTTKVIDAFAHLGVGASLGIVWPVSLSDDARSLLGELVPRLSYLGRAESLVAARVVGDESMLPDGLEARADRVNAPGYEAITLFAPLTAAQYGSWRDTAATETGPGRRRNRSKDVAGEGLPSDLLDAL